MKRLNHAEISEQTRKNVYSTPFDRKGEKMPEREEVKHIHQWGCPICGTCICVKCEECPYCETTIRISDKEWHEIREAKSIRQAVEALITRYVEQAVLAAEAAENKACAKRVREWMIAHGMPQSAAFAEDAIRSRMTQPRAAALEKVREEARAGFEYQHNVNCSCFRTMPISSEGCACEVVIKGTLAQAEAEAQRLREALRKYGQHSYQCKKFGTLQECTCGFETALSAKAVPDGR